MNDVLTVTTSDLRRLEEHAARMPPHARDAAALDTLLDRLQRATTIDSTLVPTDVVTLDSSIALRDVDTGRPMSLTVVAPGRGDAAEGRISVLAPLGGAVFGRRAGREVAWHSPAGPRRVRIEAVLWQPESARRAGAAAPVGASAG